MPERYSPRTHKVCSKCGEDKVMEEFALMGAARRADCKECQRLYQRERRHAEPVRPEVIPDFGPLIDCWR